MEDVLLDDRNTYVSPTRVVIGGVTYSVNGITSVETTRPFLLVGLLLVFTSLTCCGLPSLGATLTLADPSTDVPLASRVTSAVFFVGLTFGLVVVGGLIASCKAVVLSTSGLQKRALVTLDGGHANRVREAIDRAITHRG